MDIARRKVIKYAAFSSFSFVENKYSLATNNNKKAEWLILYYINGKNNLVSHALEDFFEISSIGSSDSVKIVVQLGRPEKNNPPSHEGWSGVKRYIVEKGMKPDTKSQAMHVGEAKTPSGDMGNPETLESFIDWAVQRFPARRKILIIWNHGQGWRFQASKSNDKFAAATRAPNSKEIASMADAPVIGMFKSVSSDDDNGSILYNKQIQKTLEKCAAKGTRFDIVAYDACLMAMVETAYSLRKLTDILVSSQELEPGAGWEHSTVLKSIVSRPTMTPEEFSKVIVDSYQERYGNNFMTTMSAIRLVDFDLVTEKISSASAAIRIDHRQSFRTLEKERANLRAFADFEGLGFSVDCETLFERIANASNNPIVAERSKQTAEAIRRTIIANYASTECKAYSPRGIAIYFPESKLEFYRDHNREGYLRSNKFQVVDFVVDNEWALLMKDYLNLPG